MEKLGLKEGEHIESSLVTRSVQNAQKKVENLHFESRKHLLEYDDVANEQRKSVYKFRNELLDPDYDMIQRIQDNRSLALAQTINKIRFQDEHSLELDTNALIAIIKEEFGLELESEALSKINPAEIEEYINHQLTNSYEEKMSHLPPQQRNEIERIIYLQILDNLWREHLYAMDTLKTGIGLRGYNQKDPLVEYKKESYNLFMELVEQIKIQAVKTLHIIRLQAEENPQNQTQEIIHDLKAQDKNLSFNKDEIQQNLDFEAKKISRNDPCPCGSGKKYKLCHGRSGPKKGMLAQ